MELDISEIALSFEFEGKFIFSEKKRVAKEGQEFGQPTQYVWAYIFFSEKDYLMIVPEDPRFLLGYGSDGSFECWNEDGRLSIIM